MLALAIASRSDASIIFTPGLQPGDHFRLAFVTSTSRDAGPAVGAPTSVDGTWLNGSSSENNVQRQLYGISSALTVPAPEPASIGLSCVGAAILFLARVRQR